MLVKGGPGDTTYYVIYTNIIQIFTQQNTYLGQVPCWLVYLFVSFLDDYRHTHTPWNEHAVLAEIENNLNGQIQIQPLPITWENMLGLTCAMHVHMCI